MTHTMDDNSRSKEAPGVRRILAVSDIVEPQLYNLGIREEVGPVDLIISCGDLPPHYLDFLMTLLSARCFHVVGNHCLAQHPHGGSYQGAVDLHGRLLEARGLLMAGVEGAPWYNGGPHQYTDGQVAWQLYRLIPGLVLNRIRTGRYLDILVTHAPPRGIHDRPDAPHRGFTSFLWFLRTFRPLYMLHGHIHRDTEAPPLITHYAQTSVVNVCGHRIIEVRNQKSEAR
jgi:uncharacterized protein